MGICSRRSRRSGAAGMMVSVVLLAGACGGGHPSSTGNVSSTTAATPTLAPPGSTTTAPGSTTTAPTPAEQAFCQQLISEDQKLVAAEPHIDTQPAPMEALVPAYDKLAAEAPAAVSSQVKDLAGAIQQAATAAANGGSAASGAKAAFETRVAPDIEGLATWASAVCQPKA